ncbi:nucleotidyltransferase domain-containing protein [Candidatus Pacearchaeota archaeon]|nr:nucleotidyltransferase domain-containing protein [Candidatus Pacearchaeota archaeon]
MDIYKLKWTSLQAKIFSFLCARAGEKLSQREIAIKLEVSPTAVANALTRLKDEELINIEKVKNINFVSFNRDGKKALKLKITENLRNIYLSGLEEYLEVQFAGATVILFGSYARGEDTNTSDIDLSVVGRKNKLVKLEEFEKILNRKININFYESFKKIHKHLLNNILNGIILAGSVEL